MPIPFAFRLIKFTCPCHREVYAVDSVGVTSDYQLYVQWECSCGRECQVVMPLEHITEMAPPAPLAVNAITELDKQFAKQAHISLE